MINYDDFAKLELKVGKILEVEVHPNADKLYVIKVDIGEKVVQVVAGIKNYYTPEELKGKNVVIVANLEPRGLRGVESQGMLLAAHSGDTLTVITTDRDALSGSIVK